MADRNTLLPEFALVAKHQPLELSIPLRSFGFGRMRGCPVRSVLPSTSGRRSHQVITGLSKHRDRHQR
jgi:hypothetical protein